MPSQPPHTPTVLFTASMFSFFCEFLWVSNIFNLVVSFKVFLQKTKGKLFQKSTLAISPSILHLVPNAVYFHYHASLPKALVTVMNPCRIITNYIVPLSSTKLCSFIELIVLVSWSSLLRLRKQTPLFSPVQHQKADRHS